MAEGLTNAQIAAKLHLSERTIENHVFNALSALGLHNRVQLATWTTEIRRPAAVTASGLDRDQERQVRTPVSSPLQGAVFRSAGRLRPGCPIAHELGDGVTRASPASLALRCLARIWVESQPCAESAALGEDALCRLQMSQGRRCLPMPRSQQADLIDG